MLSLCWRKGRRFVATGAADVFDRRLKRLQKDRADPSGYFHYIRDEVARRVVDRIRDIKRELPVCVDLGCGHGHIAKQLTPGIGSIKKLIQIDPSLQTVLYNKAHQTPNADGPSLFHVCSDEEFLPLAPGQVDLVVSSLSLNWVNDLVSCLTQVQEALRPDGVFIGAMLGGDTLQELRSAFAVADMERLGGLSPHVSPMVNPADAGGLLHEAGFVISTVDTDKIVCQYPDMFTLMEHLQHMGESNVSFARRNFVSRDIFAAAASAYEALYADPQGLIPATFHVIYMIGWSPDPTKQQQPLKRGSASHSLKDM